MPEDDGQKQGWWERNVEAPVAAHLDRERAAIPEEARLTHDIQVGVTKGVYHFGKGIVTGIIGIAGTALKFCTDPDYRSTVLDKADRLARDFDKLQNGTPEEQLEVAKRAADFGDQMYEGIKQQVKKDWEQAGKEGKRAELISKWGTQGVLEVASMFVGIGEAKAALKGAEVVEKAGELAKVGRAADKLVSKCEKAEELAKIAKNIEKAKKAEAAVGRLRKAEELAAGKKAMPRYKTPHKPLSAATRKELQGKLSNRTITREEFEHLDWDRRFANRRATGVRRFWAEERARLRSGKSGTRNWTPEQKADIVAGRTPKINGEPMRGHHRCNALDHPQIADDPANIYPVTPKEHLDRWHGGNWRNDTYGEPLHPTSPEEF